MSSAERVQSFWHGGELSPLAWASLSSFVHFGHDAVLYTYDEIKVPKGVRRKDAGGIVNREALFDWQGMWQPFSNVFRYNLIAREGGWWIDTDVVCLTGTLPPGELVFARELGDTIACGQFKMPVGHATLRVLIREASAIGRNQSEWGQTGPRLFTKVLKDSGEAAQALDPHTLYPLHWLEAFQLWMPDRRRDVGRKSRGAYCLHVYSAILRNLGVDFWTAPPLGSYLAGLYAKYPFYAPLKPLTPDRRRETAQAVDAFLAQEWVQYQVREYQLDCRTSSPQTGKNLAGFLSGLLGRLKRTR